MAAKVEFKAALMLEGKTATGFAVPEDAMAKLGSGKRAPVRVTINGYSYRYTVAVMRGKFLIGVAAEHREKMGAKAGDLLDVTLELDTTPREVEVPKDLAKALAADKQLKVAFDALSFTYRKEHARALETAKAPETRARRLTKILDGLKAKAK